MVDSIARLMAWKLSLSYRDPNGTTVLTSQGGGTSKYRAGTKVTFNVISGHRDAGNTECPGTNLYTQLATDPAADDAVPRHRADRPAARRRASAVVRQRRQHHDDGPGHQRPGLDPAGHGRLSRHRRADPDRDGVDRPCRSARPGTCATTRRSRSDPGPTR